MSKTVAQAVTPEMLAIIKAPVVTEKSTLGLQQANQVTFKVATDATKPQIKAAIEAIYNVKVKAVNTSILKGKVKRFRGILGKRSDIKKAVITLEAGQQIDLTVSV